MSLAYCTMTSRSARLLLSEQEKSNLLGKVSRVLQRIDIRSNPVGLAYRELRVVIEARELVIKIMTEHEFRRLHPLLTVIQLLPVSGSKAA